MLGEGTIVTTWPGRSLRGWFAVVLAAALCAGSLAGAPVAGAAAPVASFSTAYGFRGHAGLYPYGMEYNEHNNTILVADIWNHRVKPFTTGGAPAGGATFTGQGFGLPNNRVEPFDVEADPRNGDVYVANEAYSRVDQYRANGTWVKSLGRGGKYGQGCGGGKVFWPTNVALHRGNGRLYVSDGFCGTISAYDANFNYLPGVSFDLRRLGLNKPTVRGIDVDAAGNVWVVEHKSRTLMKFRPDGGVPVVATRVARMNDPAGSRWTAAATGERVDASTSSARSTTRSMSSTGTAATGGAGRGPAPPRARAAFDAIRYVAVDGSGNVYVGDTWKYTVYKLSPRGRRLDWAQRRLPPPDGGFNQVSGIGLHPGSGRSSQKLFAADYFEQRVQWFATHTSAGRASRCRSARRCPAWRGSSAAAGPTSPAPRGSRTRAR